MKRHAQWAVPLLTLLVATAARGQDANGDRASGEPVPDPRVGLRAGWFDAGTAAWNMRLLSNSPPSAPFLNRSTPGDQRLLNSDIGFYGHYAIQGNFSGIQVWDISEPSRPALVKAFVCPGSQSDISSYRHLLFVSGEDTNGRIDCGTEGVADTVSHDRLRGIRIFDFTDVANPRLITVVQTCRGSHTHTVVTDPRDSGTVYVYVSGTASVRSPSEMAGCANTMPDQDPSSSLFRIEVIRVPLAHPEQAAIVSSPRIFNDLAVPARHGETPADIARAAHSADSARALGAYTVTTGAGGMERILDTAFVHPLLRDIVRARGGSGAPTAADSAALRGSIQGIYDLRANGPSGRRTGPTQCHDITAYPAIGLAGGACGGYGLLLDIRDPAHPRRVGATADSNFSYWHSATFNNDGSKVLFTDEWGGGLQPRCRSSDRHEWGADAIFTLRDSTMTFRSYYKLPVAQTQVENCVAHNGSLIPIPGRDIMAQGWYQGGVSVFDWTDPAHPVEIAYFDRGPMDSTVMQNGGSWSAYWYNGYLYSSELARGLDVFELQPSALISRNELDAARTVRADYLNVQSQQRIVWPPSFALARAYLDQLERGHGLAPERISAARGALARAEGQQGQARRTTLTRLASELNGDAARSADQAKVRTLAGSVQELATAAH